MKHLFFDLAIYNRFKHGGTIAAEIEPSLNLYRKWIAIYSSRSSSARLDIPPHLYSILEFELEKAKIEEYLLDFDLIMHNEKRYFVNSETELIDKLLDLRIDLKVFTYPWRCDYPLGQ